MTLIGHDEQIAAFKAAFAEGRPHHAWLLTGPQGLGKALFAEAAAIWVLAGRPAGQGFDGARDSQAAALIASGAHPELRRLERSVNDKGNVRAVITIDEVRTLLPLLQQTAVISDWRVIIVDAADDLNRNAANALLKSLEEPPAKTLFLLISHSPSRLLPTIRSRCRTLRFARLADAEVGRIIDEQADDLSDADRDTLIRLAAGAPGRALKSLDAGIASLERELLALAATPADAAPHQALALARGLAGKAAAPRYEAFLDLAPALIARLAADAQGPTRLRALAAWEESSKLAASAQPLSLDPQQVAFTIAGRIVGLAA